MLVSFVSFYVVCVVRVEDEKHTQDFVFLGVWVPHQDLASAQKKHQIVF